MNIVYINGEYVPQDKAVISVMDRGFLFGDGVYEVIPVYAGHIFRFEQHIARLQNSLGAIRLNLTLLLEEWRAILEDLLERNVHHGENQAIYLQVTRGVAEDRKHTFPAQIQATIFAMTIPFQHLSITQLSVGIAAVTLPDIRWQWSHIKSISLLANVLLYQQALDTSAGEAILIRDGQAVEGATSNLFIVKRETIKTPPLTEYILGGVTRDLILELAKQHAISCQETIISEDELHTADEVWITSSTREIFPVVQLDNKPINEGKAGPVWHNMIQYYRNFIRELGFC
jgi:D-alanine transaminase